jgi:hypothetical protein
MKIKHLLGTRFIIAWLLLGALGGWLLLQNGLPDIPEGYYGPTQSGQNYAGD